MRARELRIYCLLVGQSGRMPKSYSNDLRWRIVWLNVLLLKSTAEVAKLLFVSPKTVDRYATKFLTTGDVSPKAHRSGPERKLTEFEQLTLVNLVLNRPGIYLHELQQEILTLTGTEVDCSTICRTLKYLGLTRRKIKHIALQQSEQKRAEFLAEISAFDPALIIWVDETGCDRRKLLRDYGYSIRGTPPRDHSLKLNGKRYSVIAAMSTEGVEDIYIVEGSVNGEKFVDFVRHCLLPVMMPFNGTNPKSLVILDNASVHHVEAVEETINGVGALVRFLPAYSPDLNPIEEVFSEVKGILKANDAAMQATMSPTTLITMAFSQVSQSNCSSYIQHCGYA